MANYYFAATTLPVLKIGDPPDITFEQLMTLFKDNLNDRDYAKTKTVRLFYDLINIRAFWQRDPLEPYGNYDINQLEENLINRTGFPDYLYAYLEKNESLEERLKHFPQLLACFFRQEAANSSQFLSSYFSFERDCRLILTAFRAKKLKREFLEEFQYEDPNEDIIAQLLAQRDAKELEPPEGYENLKIIFEETQNDPLALHQALCNYRFQKIESLLGIDFFSIDRLLGYMIQLILVEKWLELDQKRGREMISQLRMQS
jgi:hypothetical protein